jgi:SNF2 family DNA or RNA helicase
MIYKPRAYQSYTTDKIINNPEVGAFLDMGLGKTVSTLTALLEIFKNGDAKKVLIIAPKKVAESVWSDEIEKWNHLQHLTCAKILGSEKERKKALAEKADIHLINRENIGWLVALYGNNWPFDMVIVDELSSFKSPTSQRFKAMRLIRPYVNRFVGLTGTPAPNGLLDLWSQVFLIDKGKRLGESFSKYRDRYFKPDKRDGHIVFTYALQKGDELLGPAIYEKEIFDRIGDICFSMKTSEHLELPECIDNDRLIHLSPENLKIF